MLKVLTKRYGNFHEQLTIDLLFHYMFTSLRPLETIYIYNIIYIIYIYPVAELCHPTILARRARGVSGELTGAQVNIVKKMSYIWVKIVVIFINQKAIFPVSETRFKLSFYLT